MFILIKKKLDATPLTAYPVFADSVISKGMIAFPDITNDLLPSSARTCNKNCDKGLFLFRQLLDPNIFTEIALMLYVTVGVQFFIFYLRESEFFTL